MIEELSAFEEGLCAVGFGKGHPVSVFIHFLLSSATVNCGGRLCCMVTVFLCLIKVRGRREGLATHLYGAVWKCAALGFGRFTSLPILIAQGAWRGLERKGLPQEGIEPQSSGPMT